MKKVLQTKNLSKSYGKAQVLKNIDLTITSGEFTAIMGPSGSGKTTLMNVLSTIDKFSGGEVWLEEQALLDLNKKALRTFRQERMGFIFQDYNLLDTLTIKENILLPLSLRKFSTVEMERRLKPVIQALNIEEIQDKYPTEVLAVRNNGPHLRAPLLQTLRLSLQMNLQALLIQDQQHNYWNSYRP